MVIECSLLVFNFWNFRKYLFAPKRSVSPSKTSSLEQELGTHNPIPIVSCPNKESVSPFAPEAFFKKNV